MATIILAPHPDDEIIGCFGILSEVTDVYIFYECSVERQFESLFAKHKARATYNLHFTTDFDKIDFNKVKKVYAPGSFDLHPDHRKINRLAKLAQSKHKFDLMFYSIDMNRKPYFLKDKANIKKDVLTAFASQGLLKKDDKYHLFEDIYKQDFIRYYKYKIQGYKVKVSKQLDVSRLEKLNFTIDTLSIAIQHEIENAELIISDKYQEAHFKI